MQISGNKRLQIKMDKRENWIKLHKIIKNS